MGNGPSSLLEEGKVKGSSSDIAIYGTKIKTKEVAKHVKKLETDFPNLSELRVHQCRLKIIPNNVTDLTELTILDLDENKMMYFDIQQVAKVPDTLQQLTNLKELILSHNALVEFPYHLFSIPSLTSLNLSHNPLERTQTAVLLSPSILDLRMEGTGLTAFPTKVCGLHTLTSLFLADNQLSILPPEISQLTSLTTLSLARNKFSQFPTDSFTLNSLKHLDLSENEMDVMWSPGEFTPDVAIGAHLTELELQHNKISDLPEVLFDQITSLVILKLHDNKLTFLPPQISKLGRLKELWLQENELTELPAEIGHLTSLRKLYLEYNELKSLPSEIQHVTNLVVLILHHNQLTSIPKELRAMRQLLRLSLDDNQFEEDLVHRLKTEGALSVVLSSPQEDQLANMKGKRMSFSRSALNAKYVPNHTISRSLFRPEVSRRDSTNDFDFPRRKTSNPEYPVSMHLSPEGGPPHLISTPLNLTRSAGNVPSLHKKDKTAEDLIPAYSKFKGAFESLLEGQDFSKKKREILQRMSKEQKWSLLTQYKDSTLHLLKKESSPNFTLRRHKPIVVRTPRDFCTALSGTLHPPQRTLRELHSMLSEGGSDVSTFIDLDGITHLVKFLDTLSRNQNTEATSLISESLNCMKVLVEIGLKSVLTTLDAINVVVLHMNSATESIVMIVLDIMREILDVSHLGHRTAREALAYNKQAKGYTSPYVPFLNILSNPEFSSEVKTNCMNILNTIIDYSGGVESRFEIECELLILKLLDVVEVLREDQGSELLKLELDVFEQSLDDDEQEMVFLVGRKEVLRRLGHNLTPRDDIARVVVGYGGGVIGECVNVPITPASTCANIVKEILTKYPMYSNLKAEWGLFVPDLKSDKRSTKEEGYWVDLAKRPSEYRLSGEILEFRMKELSILAGLRDGPCEILKVDPYLSITEITEHLRRKFKQNNVVVQDAEVDLYDDYWAEYGLYMYSAGHYAGGEWLDDTKKLSEYDTSLKRVALRLRPRPLAIAFATASRAHHTLYFDPDLKIRDVMVEISRALPAPDRANLSKYGLYLDSNDITKTGTWLDEDKKLREYYIPKQAWVKFMRKPRPLKIRVMIGDNAVTDEVIIDQAASVGDEVSKLTNKLLLLASQFSAPEDYDLSVLIPGSPTPANLSRELTFSEQGVPENSTLVLKAKSNAASREINIWDEPNWGEYKLEECPTHSPTSPRAAQSLSTLSSSPSTPFSSHSSSSHSSSSSSSHSSHNFSNSITNSTSQSSPALLSVPEKKPATLIASATLNKMLEHLTSPDAYDPESRDVFFLTYPCFTTSQKLLEKLIERYTTPPSIEGSSLSRVIQQRVLVFCKHWIKFVESSSEASNSSGGSTDLAARRMAREVEEVFKNFFNNKPHHDRYHEIHDLFTKCVAERVIEPAMVYSEQPPKPRIPKQITTDQKLSWWDIDDQEIARQLTILTFSYYGKIQSFELLQQNWMKSTTAAPYVNAMIGIFNKASQWVSTAILSERLLRNRVKMLTKMIKVAQFLMEMNNFHLLMAFVSALNSSAIARLKWTQAKLSRHAKETQDELEKHMSMEGSFKSYRLALMEANPPCIPYIGVHLTDLVFIEEGNPRMVGPRINFVRHRLVAQAITSILRYQKMPPNLVKVEVIQSFFLSLPIVAEEKELFKMSLICEPRNSRAPPD